jgi:hypothetical protein
MSIYAGAKACNANLILYINQREHFKGHGRCSGYAFEFSKGFLDNGKPFGVEQDNLPPFDPIKYNENLLSSIDNLHENQNEYWIGRSFNFTASDGKNIKVRSRLESYFRIFFNAKQIAEKLISMADAEQDRVYVIVIGSLVRRSGHAISFKKDSKGHYHFLDSNFGWISFNDSKDFIRYLPFHFSKTDYNKSYNSYTIFSLENKKPLNFIKDFKSASKILVQWLLMALSFLFYSLKTSAPRLLTAISACFYSLLSVCIIGEPASQLIMNIYPVLSQFLSPVVLTVISFAASISITLIVAFILYKITDLILKALTPSFNEDYDKSLDSEIERLEARRRDYIDEKYGNKESKKDILHQQNSDNYSNKIDKFGINNNKKENSNSEKREEKFKDFRSEYKK